VDNIREEKESKRRMNSGKEDVAGDGGEEEG
jgi:hypothetical protein